MVQSNGFLFFCFDCFLGDDPVVFKCFLVFNAVVIIIADKFTMFFVVFKISGLPELPGFTVENPFTLHHVLYEFSFSSYFTVLVEVGSFIAFSDKDRLSICIGFLSCHFTGYDIYGKLIINRINL